MFSWLAEKLIARNMKAIRTGDIKPTTLLYAEDVRFSFPGDSSFAAEPQIRRISNAGSSASSILACRSTPTK